MVHSKSSDAFCIQVHHGFPFCRYITTFLSSFARELEGGFVYSIIYLLAFRMNIEILQHLRKLRCCPSVLFELFAFQKIATGSTFCCVDDIIRTPLHVMHLRSSLLRTFTTFLDF